MASEGQYIVSARKYRPATFDTVVGQRALTATLKNAISERKLAQAYLFCGPRGVGKTSCARIFAKTINCLSPTADGEACGKCESCRAIEKGNSFDLVELDAASNNSVENIRNITDQVNVPAQVGRYRVFIIDEVHMLSNNAFNAFLKTLEEPPKNVVFILATTERHKVIPTILSRCQVYDFRRITVNDIIDHLQYVAQSEGVKAEREALGVIALKADGAMRDALSIFDQVVASTRGDITYDGVVETLNVLNQEYYFGLVETFIKGDVAEALVTLKEIIDKGFDAQFFVNGLASHVRNLMVSADPRTIPLLETSEEWAKKYKEQAPRLPLDWYYSAIKILNDTDFNYKTSSNKRLLVELALIRLTRLLERNRHLRDGSGQVPADTHSNTGQMSAAQPSGNSPSVPFDGPVGDKPQTAPVKSSEAPSNIVKAETPAVPVNPVFRNISHRPVSFRISAETGKNMSSGDNSPKRRSFTDEEMLKAWEDYAVEHQEQRILVAAMRSSKPEQKREFTYRIEVNHPAQKQAFESQMQGLLDYLKKKLGNDYIVLEVEISENEADEKKLNPVEFLKMAVEENPHLAEFLKDIEAELD